MPRLPKLSVVFAPGPGVVRTSTMEGARAPFTAEASRSAAEATAERISQKEALGIPQFSMIFTPFFLSVSIPARGHSTPTRPVGQDAGSKRRLSTHRLLSAPNQVISLLLLQHLSHACLADLTCWISRRY